MLARPLLFVALGLSTLILTASACSSTDSGGGPTGYVGPNGCSRAPDCSFCQACYDTCLCNNGDPQMCLGQCGGIATGGAGGTAGAPGGGGAPSGGGGGTPTGGSGGGPNSCTSVSSGNASCDSCLHSTCCSSIEACLADATCVSLFNCINQACANASASQFNACVQQSCGPFLTAATLYNGIGQCVQASCGGACG